MHDELVCPRCHNRATGAILIAGEPTRYRPCGHLDLSADLKVSKSSRWSKAWHAWERGWDKSFSKDPWERFLLRFWAGLVITMAIGLSWEPHPPRLAWGMLVGSAVWFFILLLVGQTKR